VTVVAILIIAALYNEVTIFIVCRDIGVVAVDTISINERYARDMASDFFILFKETFRKIKETSIACSIPTISPPFFLVIDHIRLIRRVHRYNFAAGKIAFSVIQFSLISKGNSAALSLIWAK
jgi:hypothetical protein